YAKLEAEARGQYEILAKKGDGLKKVIDACGSAQAAFQLLMLEHLDALAHASAQAISNIKFDKVVVWEGGGHNGEGSSTAAFLQNMARVMPPMLQVMKDVGGVEVPEYLARLTGDNPADGKIAPVTAEPRANGHPTATTAPVVTPEVGPPPSPTPTPEP